jgi:hypothetical protein
MIQTMKLTRLASAMAACALLSLVTPWHDSHAANHTLSKTADTFANGFEWVDLTVNVDWDYQAGLKHFNDPSINIDKTYITKEIAQLARSVYVMTNGRQKLRNVYVFNNKEFGENVDIQFLNKEGRAYASGFSGFGFEGFSTYNFMGMNQAATGAPANVINEAFLGQVVAHELGHYFYGFADEYVEAGKAADATNPGAPIGTDTARDTIMNNHETFARLSTTADYNASTQTAQSRVYATGTNNAGASAWETLIRDPQLDGTVAKSDQGHSGRRKWFAAFKGMTTAPAVADLKSNSAANSADVTGYDTELKILFKNGATVEAWNVAGPIPATPVKTVKQRKVILIDRTLPTATLNEAIAAAQGMLAQAVSAYASNPVDYAVVVSPAQTGLALRTTLTGTSGDITALSTSLTGITSDTSGALDLQAAYAGVKTGLLPALADNPVVDSLEIITRQGATAPEALGTTARTDKVALNIVGLRVPASAPAPAALAVPAVNPVPLAEAAKSSGGDYNTAKTGSEALRDLSRSAAAIQGKVFNLIDAASAEPLTASSLSKKFTFYQSAAQYDGNLVLTWYFDPADASKLTFFFGKKGSTLGNATAGASYSRDDTNGTVKVVVSNSLASGAFEEWEAEVRATGATTEGVEFEVASDASSAQNPISLGANLTGGTKAATTKPVITARFGGRLPIRGGDIKANIYRISDGTLVLQDLVMADDGSGADERANDGVYTISLDNKLPAGEYTAIINASTVPGTSKFNPNQIQAFGGGGTAAELTIADEIERLAEIDFTLESAAPGVMASSSSTSSTSSRGGCTVAPGTGDSSLILLVLSAFFWRTWLRRNKQ